MTRKLTPQQCANLQQSGRDSWLSGIDWTETEIAMIRSGDFTPKEIEQVIIGYASCEMLLRNNAFKGFKFKNSKNGEQK